MRTLAGWLLTTSLLVSGCADLDGSLVMGGFLLGLPEPAAAGGSSAELTVFLGQGNTPLEVAANTITDAERVQGVAGEAVVVVPHVAEGFYILTTGEDPELVYEPAVSWDVSALVDGREAAVSITTPPPAALFGAPLDGSWTLGQDLTLALPTGAPDRAFAWVNGPTGAVTWTDEPVNTGALLQWLDQPSGVAEVLIPGAAFTTPGEHRVVVVAAVDADAGSFRGVASRSSFAAGAAQTLVLDVQ